MVNWPGPGTRSAYVPSGFEELTSTCRPAESWIVSATPGSGTAAPEIVPATAHSPAARGNLAPACDCAPITAVAAARNDSEIARFTRCRRMLSSRPSLVTDRDRSEDAARRDPRERSLDTRHVGVNHGRQVERHQLREDQSPDDDQAERLARFAAGPVAERDRHRAKQRRHGRHHDRPEPD